MKKYLVPCGALLGIALLASGGHAANLIVKGRVMPAGGKVSVRTERRNSLGRGADERRPLRGRRGSAEALRWDGQGYGSDADH
jgi:hypothetical protein